MNKQTTSKTARERINFIVFSDGLQYIFAFGFCQYFTICVLLMGTNAENTELTVQSKNPITKHNSVALGLH